MHLPELNIVQHEGPHIVTETVCVQFASLQTETAPKYFLIQKKQQCNHKITVVLLHMYSSQSSNAHLITHPFHSEILQGNDYLTDLGRWKDNIKMDLTEISY
jgi:hypothetical protein